MNIEPNVHYALFRAVDAGTDFQSHILLDLRITRDVDNLICEVEGVRLNYKGCVVISQYRAVLDAGLGGALEDLGLQLALEEYEDEDGARYEGVDLFSGDPLSRALDRDYDMLVLRGDQLLHLMGDHPDLLGEDPEMEPRVEIIITPDGDGDFWIRPSFGLSSRGHYMELEGVNARLPWSHLRRKFLEYAD